MSIKVRSDVTVYEMGGKEIAGPTPEPLVVLSHWNRSEMVVLRVPGTGQEITVSAKDLHAAIANAQNTARFGL